MKVAGTAVIDLDAVRRTDDVACRRFGQVLHVQIGAVHIPLVRCVLIRGDAADALHVQQDCGADALKHIARTVEDFVHVGLAELNVRLFVTARDVAAEVLDGQQASVGVDDVRNDPARNQDVAVLFGAEGDDRSSSRCCYAPQSL